MSNNLQELQTALDRATKAFNQAQEELKAAKTREAVERQKPLRALAARAHNCLCQYNHTDGCSWSYEEDRDPDSEATWAGWTHQRWLSHMETLQEEGFTVDQIGAIIQCVTTLRAIHPKALWLVRGGANLRLTP